MHELILPKMEYTADYAETYDALRNRIGPYGEPLVSRLREQNPTRVLEIGCGTGRVLGYIAKELPTLRLFGLDRSPAMLDAARKRLPQADCILGDAARLPLAEESVDAILGVLMLQHLPDWRRCIREGRRVLRNGLAAFVTIPHNFIRNYPTNPYFPSFARIDLARFPDENDLCGEMERSGFHNVRCDRYAAEPVPIDADYLKKIEARFVSTYALLPEDEFAEGVARMNSDIARLGSLAQPMVWQGAMITGIAT
jgi:SAM-dependent methyltransferase